MKTELTKAESALRSIVGFIGNVEHKGSGPNDARRYADMLNGII